MLAKLQNSPAPALLWQGNDGFILWDGKTMIATDLDLTLGERILPPTADVDELAEKLDVLMITHGHEDHFSTATVRKLLERDRCRFLIPESCREKAMGIEGLAERAVFCKPGDRLEMSGMQVECMRALHGHIACSVYSGASLQDCGYCFSFGDLTFYQPGDTVLLEEHLEMRGVDVLFLSPTEHNTWIENSLRMVRAIQPGKVIFQHHSTYHEAPDNLFWTRGYVQEVLDKLTVDEKALCIVPDQNTVIAL